MLDPKREDDRSVIYSLAILGACPSGTALPALRASDPSGLRRVASHGAASLERCDYCGCSRHACGCDDRFEYEQIRDNPTLIAR